MNPDKSNKSVNSLDNGHITEKNNSNDKDNPFEEYMWMEDMDEYDDQIRRDIELTLMCEETNYVLEMDEKYGIDAPFYYENINENRIESYNEIDQYEMDNILGTNVSFSDDIYCCNEQSYKYSQQYLPLEDYDNPAYSPYYYENNYGNINETIDKDEFMEEKCGTAIHSPPATFGRNLNNSLNKHDEQTLSDAINKICLEKKFVRSNRGDRPLSPDNGKKEL